MRFLAPAVGREAMRLAWGSLKDAMSDAGVGGKAVRLLPAVRRRNSKVRTPVIPFTPLQTEAALSPAFQANAAGCADSRTAVNAEPSGLDSHSPSWGAVHAIVPAAPHGRLNNLQHANTNSGSGCSPQALLPVQMP